MNRRTVLVASTALLVGPTFGPVSRGLAAQATPVVGGEAGPIVSTYAEVGARYDAESEAILAQGREIVAQLLKGNAAGLYGRLSAELRQVVSEEMLAELVPSLETDRVHMELPELGVVLDGHLRGETIEGSFHQGSTTTFALEADPARATRTPLDGRWVGQVGVGEAALSIEVTFQTVDGVLGASLAIPMQSATSMPLVEVELRASVPIGARTSDVGGPLSATNRAYLARHAWGDAEIATTIGITADGQIAGLTVAPEWPLPVDPEGDHVSPVRYRLPFDGVWWVFWGGGTTLQNYHAGTPSQRHAYDIVIWKDGATHRGDGSRNEDYWAYGQQLLAPAGGTVVAVVDGLPDNQVGVLAPVPHPAGNHIVIQTAEREFVFLAHLQPGSMRVKRGDRVVASDPLGLSGNSGNSSEAHLHIHVQDRAEFFTPDAVGMPLVFSDYLANGEAVSVDGPVQGQFISNA